MIFAANQPAALTLILTWLSRPWVDQKLPENDRVLKAKAFSASTVGQ